tara:strand:- start:494 stop:841 length:348 start_codon:yes stop_codon:yes gene_type:complete
MADKFLFLTKTQWDFIELSSASIVFLTAFREAADVIGRRGIAGRLKSKRLVKLSRLGLERDTWTTLNTISIVFGAFLTTKFTYQQFKAKGLISDARQQVGNQFMSMRNMQRGARR